MLKSVKDARSFIFGNNSLKAGLISNNSSLTIFASYLVLNSLLLTEENFRSYLNRINMSLNGSIDSIRI